MDGNETPPSVHQAEQEKMYRHRDVGEKIELIARWIVDILAFIPSLIAAIVSQFLKPGTSGARLAGSIGFGLGVTLSADSIWQVLFQGVPLFPWFEKSWIGWLAWLGLPFNLFFWMSVVIGALIAVVESKSLRGKSPEQARADFDAAKGYKLPEKPKDTIDYARALWGDYKKAGMTGRRANGLIAFGFWFADIASTFVARNPFSFTDPGTILSCLLYNFFTILAAEIGYKVREDANRPR